MENNKTQNVANQTEIPVDQAPKIDGVNNQSNKSLMNVIKNIPIKFAAVGGILIIILIVVISALFMMDRTDTADAEYIRLSNDINNAYQSGNLDEAERITDEALNQYGDDAGFLASKINIISARGNISGTEEQALQESQEYIDKILTQGGDNLEASLAIGYAYETAGEYENALEYYTKATEINPSSSDAWFGRGHSLDFLGRTQEALDSYNKSYELGENNPRSLMARANQLYFERNVQGSFETFIKASEVEGVSSQLKAEALASAAVIRRTQNGFNYISESLEISKKAVDASPNFSPALSAYGYNLFLTREEDEGIRYMEMAIAANPRISNNYYSMATFYRARKDFGNAINYHKEAVLRIDNDNTIVSPQSRKEMKGKYTYELARTYQLSGLPVNTLSMILEAVNDKPSLKDSVIHDVNNNGFFADLRGNQEFEDVIR